jgi:hypothetical protein
VQFPLDPDARTATWRVREKREDKATSDCRGVQRHYGIAQ